MKFALLLILLLTTQIVKAQDVSEYYYSNLRESPRVENLTNAMQGQLFFCKTMDGTPIPILSCNKALGGCRNRLSYFAQYILEASEKHDINPWLLASIAYNESRFNPFAVGSVGEKGIFQIHPKSKRGKALQFVRNTHYRVACQKEEGNCQKEVTDSAAELLASARDKCKEQLSKNATETQIVNAMLTMYNTGRCSPTKTKYVRKTKEALKLLIRNDLFSETESEFLDKLNYRIIPSCNR